MKPIKILFLLSGLSFTFIAKAQFFPDSLVATGIQTLPSVSQGYDFFLRYYRDSVTFDSSNSSGEYFTVEKRMVGVGSSKTKFLLRVLNKQVYISGTLNYTQQIVLKDHLLYDYNLTVGDTFYLNLSIDSLKDVQYRVDSIKLLKYKDGIKRMTHFYHILKGMPGNRSNVFFSAEGLGSTLGVMYLQLNNAPVLDNQLISDCTPSKLIYGNDDCNILGQTKYHFTPYCEEDSIVAGLERVLKADIADINTPSSIGLFPNPASGLLTLTSASAGVLNIMDNAGKICLENIAFEQGVSAIDISGLREGVYNLILRMGNTVAARRISVLNQ